MRCPQLAFAPIVCVFLAGVLADRARGDPLGTAITYQGRITDDGQPVNGACDMAFRLFSDPTGGVQAGPTLTFDGLGGNPPPVNIVDGLFTVKLDFGVGVFQNDQRFLEIGVRFPSGSGGYTTLAPRQPITAAPEAIHAQQASQAETLVAPASLKSNGVSAPTLDIHQQNAAGTALNVRGGTKAGAGNVEIGYVDDDTIQFLLRILYGTEWGEFVVGVYEPVAKLDVQTRTQSFYAPGEPDPTITLNGGTGSAALRGDFAFNGSLFASNGVTAELRWQPASGDFSLRGFGDPDPKFQVDAATGDTEIRGGLTVGQPGSEALEVFLSTVRITAPAILLSGNVTTNGDLAVSGSADLTSDSPSTPTLTVTQQNPAGEALNVGGRLTADAVNADVVTSNDVMTGTVSVQDVFEANANGAVFLVPINATGPFNAINNIVTDTVQVSADQPIAPAVDVTGTANFAPLVRIFNFLGSALALQVQGNAQVTGSLSKGGGSFKIDHPLDPAHKYLYHSFVESPDMMNIYNGNIVTDAEGHATVELPTWFEALNRDFRYQLTVIDNSDDFVQAKVTREVVDNVFAIRTSRPHVKVSWQVTGIRQDAWANANRIPVEVDKPDAERGTYLHPEAFGKRVERGIAALADGEAR